MTQINKKKLLLTTPDLVVLSLLSERPMHGYDINQELEKRDVQDWAGVSRPQVYYSLNKLKSLQMIAEATDSEVSEGPERLVYRVTQKGKQGFINSLDNDNWAINRPISPFLTWMALSTHATRNAIVRILKKRRQFLKAQIRREKLTLKSLESDANEMTVPGLLMVELTIKQFELELHWMNKVEKNLLC